MTTRVLLFARVLKGPGPLLLPVRRHVVTAVLRRERRLLPLEPRP